MNKKIGIGCLVAGGLTLAVVVLAQGMMGGYQADHSPTPTTAQNQEIQQALQNILTSQNVSSISHVDCANVSDAQFAALGDASMRSYLSQAQHQAMDQMMGGEGSTTLQQAHVNMGRSYLGCWSGYNSNPIYMPMMGYSGYREESGYGPGSGMMDWNWAGGGWGQNWSGIFPWITTLLVWALLILGIIATVKWLRRE